MTNYDTGCNRGLKQPSGLHLRSCTVASCKTEKMANFISALINSEGLLWSARVRSTCVPIHFLKVCCEKASLLRCSPHVGRLHLLFITSWLYFSCKFQAGVQSAKKASLCSLYVCGLLLFLFVRTQIKPRFSFFPAETFPNIWEYIGLSFWQECAL